MNIIPYSSMEDILLIVEHCIRCNEHKWFTNHKEEKYNCWANKIKDSIHNYFPQFRVEINNQEISDLFYLRSSSKQKKDNQLAFPRLGSFEIYLNDYLIFSKLQSKTWPSMNNVLKEINLIISCGRSQDKTRNLDHEIKNNILSRRNSAFLLSSSDRLLAQKEPKSKLMKNSSSGSQKSIFRTHTRKIKSNDIRKGLGTRKKHKSMKDLPFAGLEHKNSSVNRSTIVSPTFQKLTEHRMSLNDYVLTKVKISLPINKSVSKKISVFNDTLFVKSFEAESSDTRFLVIKNPKIMLNPRSTDFLKILCLKQDVCINKKVILLLKSEGITIYVYQIELDYKNND